MYILSEKELMIGNLVIFNSKSSKSVKQIKSIDENCVSFSSYLNNIGYDEIYPIKITHSWLINLGFKKNNECFFIEDKINVVIADDCVYVDVFDDYNCTFNFVARIIYVHQLQNLYFALTQTELTLS